MKTSGLSAKPKPPGSLIKRKLGYLSATLFFFTNRDIGPCFGESESLNKNRFNVTLFSSFTVEKLSKHFFINIKTNYVQLTLTQFKARSFTSCVKAERFPFITNHR